MPSPLLYDGVIYLLKTNSGILSAYDATTGKPLYALQRLEGVPQRVRIAGWSDGTPRHPGTAGHHHRHQVRPSARGLASNTLDDAFDASPALVGTELYWRGARYLYSIGK